MPAPEVPVTTPTIEQIYQHASIRKYKSDPVPTELVEQIVAASQRSSTSSNMQTWTVIAVTDDQKKARLKEIAGNQKHILQAPVFLTWCADLSRLDRISELIGYDHEARYVENFIIASVDAAIAMQTATLAAESLGLGMCYIGALRNDPRAVIELLELPKLVFPVCGMTLGWPDDSPVKKPRLPLDVILHREKYGVEDEETLLRQYDREIFETGVYGDRMVPVPGGEGEMRQFSWMERSVRKVAKPLRAHIKQVLEEQGFELR